MADNIELTYTGDGAQIGEAPTRDLTHEEVELYGGKAFLLSSGLYAEASKPAFTSKPTKSALKNPATIEGE